MSRVVAPSRLHFGLFNAGNLPGVRSFGGCGLMIEKPGVIVVAERATAWIAEGPSVERALQFAQKMTREPFRITVESCPPEHVGLGVGTQLALAVAKAIALELGSDFTPAVLAARVGRGERSAIGLHGFHTGGFLVDAGKSHPDSSGLALLQLPFPQDWRIVLARPKGIVGLHGEPERAAFQHPRDEAITDKLARLALLGMAPAVAEADWPAFGEALYEFNRLSGGLFKAAQGGHYAGPEVEALIGAMRDFGVPGAGQSSWGPTVFGIARDAEQAGALVNGLTSQFPNAELAVTNARNRD